MTRKEAQRIARRLAYEAVQKSVECGGEDCANVDDQIKVDRALDEIAQRMFNRLPRAPHTETETP